MGAIYSYNRGKFIFGKNSNEVNQAWQGQDSPTREVRVGNSTIWPSFTVGAISNTLTFTPSANSSKAQGDFTIVSENGVTKYKATNKEINVNDPIEIDPAGGNGTIKIITRENSLWHQLSLVGQIQEKKEKENISAKIDSFTINAPSHVSAEVVTDNYSYKNSTYLTQFTLKVNSNDDGTTKLTKEQEHDVNYMPRENYDILLNWSVEPNNNSYATYVAFRLNSFYDLLGRSYKITENSSQLFKVWQKPNTLYYVHLAFLNEDQGNNYIGGGPIETSDSITVDYNAKKTTFYTFVELGISPDGGQNIYWNDAEKGSSIDNAQVSDLTLSVDNTTALNYQVSVIEHNITKPNLFKCVITSNVNDETTNTIGMTQNYSIIDKKFNGPIKSFISKIDESTGHPVADFLNMASFAESSVGSKVSEKFKIARSTNTQPISVNITASFNYGKFHI